MWPAVESGCHGSVFQVSHSCLYCTLSKNIDHRSVPQSEPRFILRNSSTLPIFYTYLYIFREGWLNTLVRPHDSHFLCPVEWDEHFVSPGDPPYVWAAFLEWQLSLLSQ